MSAREQVCISPIDGREVARRAFASNGEIDAALDRATDAQLFWKSVPLDDRKAIVAKFIEVMEVTNPEIVEELAIQMGRPIRYGGELGSLKDRAESLIEIADEGLAPYVPPAKQGFTRMIKRVPKGVVFSIVPWNYPYLAAVNSVVPALLAGNAVILKHSGQTLLAGERLAGAFEKAGLPTGVFQNLILNHEATSRIIGSNRVHHVSFTGSVNAGKQIEAAAVGTFASVTLELGGKDPAYVRPDADLTYAAEQLADGAFYNTGQCCCAIERIYVHESVYGTFVDQFLATASAYVLGDPLDEATTLGPMAAKRFADDVRTQVSDAVSKGARDLVDPSPFTRSEEGTPYVRPYVLVDVDHSMEVMMEETFGPVAGIMKVKSDTEAIQLMNDSHYGLTASVWTSDEEAAMSLGDQISTGIFLMNRCDYGDPYLAWTGVKDTGRGVSMSVLGFEALTRPMSFHLKHL